MMLFAFKGTSDAIQPKFKDTPQDVVHCFPFGLGNPKNLHIEKALKRSRKGERYQKYTLSVTTNQ